MTNASASFRHVWSKSFFFVVIGFVSVLPCTAHAANLCTEVRILVRQAHSNFSNQAMTTPETTMPPMLSNAEECTITQSLSGLKTYHCKWEFPYRTKDAYSTFDAFNRALRECLGKPAPSNTDQRVNHPDFYDVRQYQLDEIKVAVSIKDKSALQRTYLFLRVDGRNLD